MRSDLLALAAACTAGPAAAYLQPPASFSRSSGLAPHISLRNGNGHGAGRSITNTRARSTLPLRMSADASEDAGRAAKITVMKKLAEDAARALEEARLAEEKASAMRRENGQQSRSLNRGSDIRTKMLLGSVSDVLYKTWNGVLAGRPVDEAHDFLGLSHGEDLTSVGESERRDRVRALFQRFDTDADGRISETELAVGIKQVLEFDASEVQLQQLMREVDGDGDGKIDLDELTKVCLSIFNKAEAEAMTAADAATAAAAKQARTRTFTSVMEALDGAGGLSVDSFPKVALVGNATAAVRALDGLKKDGKIALWDSAPRSFQSTGADRMKAVTGMVNPEKDLGLAVDAFTRFRYQGVSLLGLSGAVALLVAGFPGPWWDVGLTPDRIAWYGYATLMINVVFTIFAPQLEKINMQRLLNEEGDGNDRWMRRQAGRFVAAYLCGVPVESLSVDDSSGKSEILIFSKKSGNIDIESLRKAAAASVDSFLDLGLTKTEVDRQSIIQMFGLVAEYRRYGKATVGFRFFRELDDQLDLSQTLIGRREKQVQARFGVTMAYQLLDRHPFAFEKVVEAFTEGKSAAEAVAIFEAAVAPDDWREIKATVERSPSEEPVKSSD